MEQKKIKRMNFFNLFCEKSIKKQKFVTSSEIIMIGGETSIVVIDTIHSIKMFPVADKR